MMPSRLSLYLGRRIAFRTLLFIAMFTLPIILTQMQRFLDLVVIRGKTIELILYLTALTLPSIASVTLPIALLGALLYEFHQLLGDSELVAMWASGYSRGQLVRTVLSVGLAVTALSFLFSLYLMPASQSLMETTLSTIRINVGDALLNDGSFATPRQGLTIFVRDHDHYGRLHGILIEDDSDGNNRTSYLAKDGWIQPGSGGSYLTMENGQVERLGSTGAPLSVLRFDSYVFNLSKYISVAANPVRDPRELFLPDLFRAFTQTTLKPADRREYLSEIHKRLSSPLYCLAFALLGCLGLSFRRGNYAIRYGFIVTIALALRTAGYGISGLARDYPVLNYWLYAIPLGGLAMAASFEFLPQFPSLWRRFLPAAQ